MSWLEDRCDPVLLTRQLGSATTDGVRLLHPYRIQLFGLATLAFAISAGWATSSRSGERSTVTIEVLPAAVELDGTRAVTQLVITAKASDGTLTDVTAQATVTAESDLIRIEPTAFVRGQKDGETALVVEVAGQRVRMPVSIRRFAAAIPVSFRNEVVAALNVGGCNQGACHGSPTGKNGFRLSLRGSDPAADLVALTRDQFGRRSLAFDPERSLIMQKARGVMPHDGGPRWSRHSIAGNLVRDWLADGMSADPPAVPTVVRVEILPGDRTLTIPSRQQQLAVRAHLTDGRASDVTRLSVFSSSDPRIADVDDLGQVAFERPGEVAILVRYLSVIQVVRLACIEHKADFRWPDPPEHNAIDRIIFEKLKRLELVPSDICSDADFFRRLSLDLTGALPSPEAARAFLSDPTPNKRARAIDRMLDLAAYADFWALKWADVLRTSRKSMQSKGAFALHDWLRAHLVANTPFDRIVRELLTASGSTAVEPAANFYRVARDPPGMAESVAQLFCGIRLQCAKCHNHPFDRWTQDDYLGMAAFFARVRTKADPTFGPASKNAVADAETIYLDRDSEVKEPRTGQAVAPRPLAMAKIEPVAADRRLNLAAWLTARENPFFARSVVNRVWYHLLGRGIVEPVDDFRDSNPPSHPELLDFLSREFVANKFDMRHLLRLILNSRVYQTSDQPNQSNREDVRYFARAIPRPLTAEQLLDAVSDVCGVPERFPGLPAGTRAVQLPDGDGHHPFLKAFGQPARELTCECERDGDSNLAQALQLVSGPTVHDKLKTPANRIGSLLDKKKSETELLQELYLAAFGRLPRPAEIDAAHEHLAKAPDLRKGWEDLLWALLNSHEFLFRR